MPAPTWTQKKEALRLAVAKALKLDVAGSEVLADGTVANQDIEGVQWVHQRQASRVVGGVWTDLRISSVVEIDRGHTLREYVGGVTPDLSGFRTTYVGGRSFVLTVMINTDDQESYDAVCEMGQLLRTRWRRPDVQQFLLDAGIGFTGFAGTMESDYVDEGRWYSSAITDMRFETYEHDAPDAEAPVDPWIAEVEGDGTLQTGHDQVDIVEEIHVGPVPSP